MDHVKRICDFTTMNLKQGIRFHKFRMQMANLLSKICMNSYTWNSFEWPILLISESDWRRSACHFDLIWAVLSGRLFQKQGSQLLRKLRVTVTFYKCTFLLKCWRFLGCFSRNIWCKIAIFEKILQSLKYRWKSFYSSIWLYEGAFVSQ